MFSSEVDRRSVVNPRQARALLDAVRDQQPSGPMLVAFFAVMYYAGLRPQEAISLRVDNVVVPSQAHDAQDDQTWGELHLRSGRRMQAPSGPMTEVLESGGSSSIVQRAIAG